MTCALDLKFPAFLLTCALGVFLVLRGLQHRGRANSSYGISTDHAH